MLVKIPVTKRDKLRPILCLLVAESVFMGERLRLRKHLMAQVIN